MAEQLIDRAAFGDHPLGRPVLGPEEHLRSFSREAILGFRRRQWAGSRGGAFLVGNLEHVPENQELAETFGRFPSIQSDGTLRAGAGRSSRRRWSSSATPTSRTCASPTGPRSTRAMQRERAALAVYSTLLGGSMGSRLFDEIREQRGLAYSVYAVDHAFADVPILQLSAGLESGKCVEAYTRMREIVDELRSRRARPRRRSSGRARTRPAGACSRSRTRTPSPATPPADVVHGEDVDPDAAIAAARRGDVRGGRRRSPAGSPRRPSVAVVGPHEAAEFEGLKRRVPPGSAGTGRRLVHGMCGLDHRAPRGRGAGGARRAAGRWLAGRGLGLVPVADPQAFLWAGPWIGLPGATASARRHVRRARGRGLGSARASGPASPVAEGFAVAPFEVGGPPVRGAPAGACVRALYVAAEPEGADGGRRGGRGARRPRPARGSLRGPPRNLLHARPGGGYEITLIAAEALAERRRAARRRGRAAQRGDGRRRSRRAASAAASASGTPCWWAGAAASPAPTSSA